MMFDISSSTLLVVLISLVLLIAAPAMMFSHVRAWRAYRLEELDAEEFDYRRRQFSRRMQTSAMLSVLAVALLAGHFLIDRLESDWLTIAYWIVALLAVCWIGLLALVDIWATQHHFNRQRHQAFLDEVERRAREAMRDGDE